MRFFFNLNYYYDLEGFFFQVVFCCVLLRFLVRLGFDELKLETKVKEKRAIIWSWPAAPLLPVCVRQPALVNSCVHFN